MHSTFIPRVLLLASLGSIPLACSDDDTTESQTLDARESATLVEGANLSSQFVDPSQWYLGRRSIDLLIDLGALTPLQEQVARRADGIIRNGRPNGYLGAEELAALEQSATWDSLFPAERAVVPSLWDLLVLDAPVVVTSPCALSGALSEFYDEFFVAPVHLVDIPSLAAPERALAERIQLQHDSDADATTLTGADVLRAYDNIGAYLPDEAKLLPALLEALHDQLVPPNPDIPRYQIPDQSCSASFTSAEVTFAATMTQVLGDTQGWSLSHQGRVKGGPRVTNEVELNAEPLQAGDQLVVHSFPTGEERTTAAGGALSIEVPRRTQPRGSHRVQIEVWRGGTRVERLELDFGDTLPSWTRLPSVLPVEVDGEILYPAYREDRHRWVSLDPSPGPRSWADVRPHLEIEPGVYQSLEGPRYLEVHEDGWAVRRHVDGTFLSSNPVSFTAYFKPNSGRSMVFRGEEKISYLQTPYLYGYNLGDDWMAPTW